MATLKEPFALDRSLNTTEVTPRNIADVLAEGLSHITGRTASEVEYDNTDSGLTADNVQDALDEIAESVPTLPSVDIQTAVDEFETYNGGILDSLKVTLEPVQSGSGDPSPDNVRPISGHTQAKVGDDGKNKLPNEATSQTVNGVTFDINNDGSITLNDQSTADWTGITLTSAKFLKAGTYTVSCPRVNSVDTRLIISYDGAEKVNTYNVDYKTFTLTEDKIISVRFVIRNSGVSFSNVTYYPMIELGSTATPYVPYNGYQVTVNLGGTYYSGTLDVVSGVFTPDTASVDLGTLTWTYEALWGVGSDFYAVISGIKPTSSYDEITTAITEQYKAVSRNTMYNNTGSFMAVMTNGAVKIRDNRYSDEASFTSAVSGVKLVYPLATPTPIQLSPTMVKALVGENHLSAPLEGQEITESKYKQAFTFDDVIAYIQSLS